MARALLDATGDPSLILPNESRLKGWGGSDIEKGFVAILNYSKNNFSHVEPSLFHFKKAGIHWV